MSGIDKCDANQFSHERSIYCDNGWIGDESIIHSTASIDLEMVCSDQWKKSFAQSLYMVSVSLKLMRLKHPLYTVAKTSKISILPIKLFSPAIVNP